MFIKLKISSILNKIISATDVSHHRDTSHDRTLRMLIVEKQTAKYLISYRFGSKKINIERY